MRQTERVSQASGAHKNCGSLFYINTKKTENFLGEKLQKKKKKKKKKMKNENHTYKGYTSTYMSKI